MVRRLRAKGFKVQGPVGFGAEGLRFRARHLAQGCRESANNIFRVKLHCLNVVGFFGRVDISSNA